MEPIDVARLSRDERTTIVWIYIYLASAVLSGLSSFALAFMPAVLGNQLDGITAITQFAVFVVSGFFVLRWIYRANATAQQLSPDSVSVSPGWNIGWFFVPVATLWKPFQGVRDSYQASVDPDAPYRVETPQMMKLWWGCWILSNALSNIAFRVQTQGGEVGLTSSSLLYGLAALVDIPLCIALISVVREMTAAQVNRANALLFA